MDIARINASSPTRRRPSRSSSCARPPTERSTRARRCRPRTAGNTSSRSNSPTPTRTRCRASSSTRRRSLATRRTAIRPATSVTCIPSMWNPGTHHLTFVIGACREVARTSTRSGATTAALGPAPRSGIEGRSLKVDFKTLKMMELRSSPGEVLDRVARDGEVFIVERNGQPKACLVPVSFLLPGYRARPHHQGAEQARRQTRELQAHDQRPQGARDQLPRNGRGRERRDQHRAAARLSEHGTAHLCRAGRRPTRRSAGRTARCRSSARRRPGTSRPTTRLTR